MKAYLIDPVNKTVTETTYSGDYREIADVIKARLFDAARYNDRGDAVFVDDEGLCNGAGEKYGFFWIEGYPQPLAGYGLALGCNYSTGEARDVQEAPVVRFMSLDEVRKEFAEGG